MAPAPCPTDEQDARAASQRTAVRRRALLAALGALGAWAPVRGLIAADKPAPTEVIVENYQFKPAELKVRVGTVVRWVNREPRTSHSVIWQGGAESDRFFPGEHYERRFDKPGRYVYSCGPHPEMKGVVVVTD